MFSLVRFLLAIHLILYLISGVPRAQASDGELPQVQAAYFFNFIKFVTWPEAPASPLVIRTFRSPAIAQALERAPEKSVHQRFLDIMDVHRPQDLLGADAVFIPKEYAPVIPENIWKEFSAATLVVSDWDKTLDRGGTIRLLTIGGKIRFAISLRYATELTISSKLLRLASEIRE